MAPETEQTAPDIDARSADTNSATLERAAASALAPRWRGQRGRLEVWYATVSDPASRTGLWVHHELVAPVDADPYIHGWAAAFMADGHPVLERFGPDAPGAPDPGGDLPAPAGTTLAPSHLAGRAGRLAWRLDWEASQHPLFTFPSWAWEREVLPAAQILPVPSARVRGVVHVDGNATAFEDARGDVAHIYGHGNAERWGWLHAELGGGEVLEVVSAVSRRPGLRFLRPLAFVQLRTGGRDWPRDPVVAAPLFRSELDFPDWRVHGTIGRWRLRVEVSIPPSRAVALQYEDPDRSTATCTNSEVADAEIVLERRRSRWEVISHWSLRGSAHAEIGTRP